MKWIKYLLISLFTLSVADVWACATPYASPRDYALYRVNDKEKIADKQYLYYHPSAEENCLAWQQLSDKTILPSDIYQVVYKMSLDDFEKMYHNREGNYGNSFAEWIIQKDTTLLQLLRVAKTNEYIRSKVNSRWYYPGMNLGTSMTLEDIVDVSLSITDERLRDRYLLQAVRALFTMWKYESCIELWEKEASLLPQNNIMRRLIEPYIAGAYYHVGQKDKALDYFVKSSDFESVFMCYDPKGDSLNLVDKIDIVCRYNPNAPILKNMLQEYILNLNPYSGYYELKYQVESKEFVQLLGLSQQLSADKRVKNKALWLYTTAFMQELLGNTQEASKWLSKAQKQRSNAFLAESMQVFRIFLDAKTSTYNQAYENKLLKQLKWLEGKLVAHLDQNVKDQVSSTHKLFFHQNFYYWNDAMRGILIGEVCPRMIEAGKPTLALQLANMADNMLLGEVNKIATGLVAKEGVWYGEDFSENTLHNYRYAENLYNPHDYSNSFFEMIDSLDAKTAAAYLQHVVKPASALEQYANERGYTGRDYLNDIVGTHYLRELNYSQALAYLSRVSDAYRHHHNLTLKFDPFSYLPKPIAPTAVFKLGFAQEMLRLEGAIKQAVDGDEKARLLYKYALGTLNSFKNCWPLVHYYKGTGYVNSVCRKRHWWDDAYTQRAYAQFDKLVAQACAVAEDKNIAADIQYELCNFKTVAQQYPASEKAQLIKGECDNLKDYYRSFQPVGYYY